MPLSWNEIKHRAITFSKEWQDETREEAEAKSFWDAFFHVFGQQRRHEATAESMSRASFIGTLPLAFASYCPKFRRSESAPNHFVCRPNANIRNS